MQPVQHFPQVPSYTFSGKQMNLLRGTTLSELKFRDSRFTLAAQHKRLILHVTDQQLPTNRRSILDDLFPCFMVDKDDEGKVHSKVTTITQGDLPPQDLLVRVVYSSLNYKDALTAQGHSGLVKHFPHVPGIDAAGIVVSSVSKRYQKGDEVLITGYDFGSAQWGGYSAWVCVPETWAVPLPPGLTLRQSMIYGTAGLTAAQSVRTIQNRISPDQGKVLVTGATGGVGSLAITFLAQEGFQVVAVTGKTSAHSYLKHLGAREVLSRQELDDQSGKPLLSTRWAAAVDTVGGNILNTILRSTVHRGCVTACGMVAGIRLPLTVYPFILRGVTLVGIDSAACPMQQRLDIWSDLANRWKLDKLDDLTTTIHLNQLGEYVKKILGGEIQGRTLIRTTVD